jgi:hypothetical protein
VDIGAKVWADQKKKKKIKKNSGLVQPRKSENYGQQS